jgi:hypothetical protein
VRAKPMVTEKTRCETCECAALGTTHLLLYKRVIQILIFLGAAVHLGHTNHLRLIPCITPVRADGEISGRSDDDSKTLT